MEDQIFNTQRYLAPVAIIIILVTAILAITYQLIGLHSAAVCDLVGVIGGILMFPMMRYSYRLAAHWSLFLTFGVLMAISLLANPAAIWWLVLIPAIAVAFLGKKVAIAWSIIITITVIALGIYYNFDISFNVTLPEGPLKFISLLSFIIAMSTIELMKSKIQEEVTKLVFQNLKLASLGEMTGEIAHQINNPLTVIISSAKIVQRDMLTKKFSDEKINHRMAIIENQSTRISELIKAMQTMTRDGQQDTAIETTVNDILQDVIKVSEQRIKELGIEFSFDTNKTHNINVQFILLTHVILNIFNNALDFLEENNPSRKFLKVKLKETVTGYIDIMIIDSGKGIPESLKKQIFQPFFTTKEVGKGTGLGLSIAYKIVERNKGKLFIDSKNKNTCFVIRLPLGQKRTKSVTSFLL